MLILRRRKDESIRLELPQCSVRIKVTSIQGNKVGLGIDAPGEVRIVRDELKPKRCGSDLATAQRYRGGAAA